jgi:outer membrane immunogenic protein
MNWSSSLMGRLGWLATPSTLLYATGGVTYAGFGLGADFDTFNAWGWAVGAGIEQKLGCSHCSNWSLRLEYRFTDFQNRSSTDASSNSASATSVNPNGTTDTITTTEASRTTTNWDLQAHTIRLGVVYTLN